MLRPQVTMSIDDAARARRAGLRFILNVVLDDDKRLLRVTAGDPEEAFRDLVAFARSVYEVPIPQQYDIAIGGVGFPKDSNLYQASRAPSYLFFALPRRRNCPGFGLESPSWDSRFIEALRAQK